MCVLIRQQLKYKFISHILAYFLLGGGIVPGVAQGLLLKELTEPYRVPGTELGLPYAKQML